MTLRREIRRRPHTGRHLHSTRTQLSRHASIVQPSLKSNNLKPSFSNVPLEVVAIILGYLPDFRTLFSVVQTCRQPYDSYKEHGHQIVPTILERECAKVKGLNAGHIFWELDFAIRHDFMERDHVQAVLLEQGWPLFQRLQLEELLLPLVGALAWTLYMDDRQADAVALLRMIGDGKQPFSPSNIPELRNLQLGPPTLIPVWTLLAELIDGQDQARILSDIERLKRCEQHIQEQHIHTVEIRGKKIILHPKEGYTTKIPGKKKTLRPGMQYTGTALHDNVALVKVYNPRRLPYFNGNPAPLVHNFRRGAGHLLSLLMSDEERAERLRSVAREHAVMTQYTNTFLCDKETLALLVVCYSDTTRHQQPGRP